jgi:hypothetical protein
VICLSLLTLLITSCGIYCSQENWEGGEMGNISWGRYPHTAQSLHGPLGTNRNAVWWLAPTLSPGSPAKISDKPC